MSHTKTLSRKRLVFLFTHFVPPSISSWFYEIPPLPVRDQETSRNPLVPPIKTKISEKAEQISTTEHIFFLMGKVSLPLLWRKCITLGISCLGNRTSVETAKIECSTPS